MTSSQTHFVSAAKAAEQISRALPFSLRSNRKIDQALRAAYLKFDRTEETRKLLRKHLPHKPLGFLLDRSLEGSSSAVRELRVFVLEIVSF